MTRQLSHVGRPAFTLIEIVVVIAVLSILMAILASSLWSLHRIHAAATSTMNELQSQSALADRFRADVADAHDAPEFAGDFHASPVCMLLRGKGNELLMYKRGDNAVERVVLGDGDPEIQSFRVGADQSVEFERRGNLLSLIVFGPRSGRLIVSSAVGGNHR